MYHLSIKEKLEQNIKINNINSLTRSRWNDLDSAFYPADRSSFHPRKRKAVNPPIPRRFNEEEVALIRTLYKPKENSYQILALQFKTCKGTINHVINGKGAYAQFKRTANEL